MEQRLAELIARKGKAAAETPIDWDGRREEYLRAVDDLYRQIETYLAEPIATRQVVAFRRKKELTETYLGTYAVDDLVLTVGSEQVRFSPRGRNIVGAGGRVDVIGERSSTFVIYNPAGRTWAVVKSRSPLEVTPFDENTFTDVLGLVMRY
jgi:hypothetical protein